MKNSIKFQIFALLIACQTTINASATIVSYGFSGTITYINNPSNALPSGIAYGTPFTGIFTYDTAAVVSGVDFDPSTNSGNFYFGTNGGFAVSVNVGGHVFATKRSGPADAYASFIVHNNYFGYDSLEVDGDQPNFLMDGNPIPGNPDASSILLDFYDNSTTALNTDALPTNAPVLAAFPDAHRFEVVANKGPGQLFSFSGDITVIAASPQPVLNISPQAGAKIRLAWPLAAQGFGLQQNTNLVTGSGWQTNVTAVVDTTTEHTVTLPTSSSACFFRLKSP